MTSKGWTATERRQRRAYATAGEGATHDREWECYRSFAGSSLKGHFLVSRRPSPADALALAADVRFGGAVRLPSQELHALRDDLSDIAFVPLFVVITARAEGPFEIDLPPLGEILATVFCTPAPHHDIVPLRAFLL